MQHRRLIPVVLGVALAGACGDADAPNPAQQGSLERVDRYELHGEIYSLPAPDSPASALRIRHEPIADFRNAAGDVVGMRAMVMEFPVAAGVSLDGLDVGDKVAFSFEVRWSETGVPDWQLTSIRRLPAETEPDTQPRRGPAEGDNPPDPNQPG